MKKAQNNYFYSYSGLFPRLSIALKRYTWVSFFTASQTV